MNTLSLVSFPLKNSQVLLRTTWSPGGWESVWIGRDPMEVGGPRLLFSTHPHTHTGPLLYGLVDVSFWMVVGVYLYRRRVFFKV